MARQHSRSCDCTKTELDLFAVPPTQTSIEGGSWETYFPVSTLTDAGPIEFSVPGDGEEYLDLASTQLYIKARILKPDGTLMAAANVPGPVNNWLHSLFEQVDVSLGGTVISSSDRMYAYRAHIENLLSLGSDAKETQLTTDLWYKDTAGHMDVATSAPATNADPDRNAGLVKRGTFTARSRPVEMMGRLHCDIFSTDKFLMNRVPLRLKLVRSADSFNLMSPDPAGYKVNIMEAILYIRRVEISPSVYLAQEKTLRTAPTKYPLKRVVCKYFPVPQNSTTTRQENLFQGQVPTRVIVGCVSSEAFDGAFDRNPFNFQNFDISYVNLSVKGMKNTIKPLTPRFPHQSLRSYLSVLTGTGSWNKDKGCGFDREEHPHGYCLFAWDLTADQSEGGDHFQLMRNSGVRLEIKFRQPLIAPINVIIYAEFENMLMVDSDRNVTANYLL